MMTLFLLSGRRGTDSRWMSGLWFELVAFRFEVRVGFSVGGVSAVVGLRALRRGGHLHAGLNLPEIKSPCRSM